MIRPWSLQMYVNLMRRQTGSLFMICVQDWSIRSNGGRRISTLEENKQMGKVHIIGSGMAGLGAAHYLSEYKVASVMLEKNAHFGAESNEQFTYGIGLGSGRDFLSSAFRFLELEEDEICSKPPSSSSPSPLLVLVCLTGVTKPKNQHKHTAR